MSPMRALPLSIVCTLALLTSGCPEGGSGSSGLPGGSEKTADARDVDANWRLPVYRCVAGDEERKTQSCLPNDPVRLVATARLVEQFANVDGVWPSMMLDLRNHSPWYPKWSPAEVACLKKQFCKITK